MDRAVFINKMNDGTDLTEKLGDVDDILRKSIDRVSRQCKSMIIMEELAELSKEVSKANRGTEDNYSLIEEIADVYICIDLLKIMYSISDEELMRAYKIKLLREKERC